MAKPNRRVIGSLTKGRKNLPDHFESFMLGQETYSERLGLIPREVAPSEVHRIKRSASTGNLGRLYDLYAKMESTDSRYGGLVNSFKSAIAGMPLKIIAAEGASVGEQEIAEDYVSVIEENLATLDTHKLKKEFSDAYIRGAKVFELRYGIHDYPYGKKLAMIDEVRTIPGAALRMDNRHDSETKGEMMIVEKGDFDGTPLSEYENEKFVLLEDGPGKGFYDTMGCARQCLSWYLTKIYSQLWWTEFVEVYGQPMRIARYPEGVGDKSKKTMEKFLKTLGKSAYGLFPQGMQLQLVEANKSGTVTTYQDIIKMANDEMAIAVMGQVDTMGGRKEGSYAKTKVLDGVRYEILQNVAKIVEKGFNALARDLIYVNYGGDVKDRLLPTIKPILVSPEDAKTKVETYNEMQKGGVAVPLDHYYEQTGTPKPKPGEKVIIGGRVLDYEEGLEEEVLKEQEANMTEMESTPSQ